MAKQRKTITVSILRKTKKKLETLRSVFGGVSISQAIEILIARDEEVKEILDQLEELTENT